MDLIKEIIIMDPPTKYIDRKKTKIDPKTGKLKEDVYYLTANLFYSVLSYFMRYKIVNVIKAYLMPLLAGVPKLEKMRIHLIYYKPQDTFDLDNKGYFWIKMMLDLFKTPSNRQIKNANLKGKEIKTLNVLKDDTVRYIDDIRMSYERGPHRMVIKIYGILKKDELTLF